MPLTLGDWLISVTVEDEGQTKSDVSVQLASTVSAANAEAFALEFANRVALLINGAIRSLNVTRRYQDIGAVAFATSEVERKGQFVFGTSAGTAAVVSVPSVVNNVLATNQLDIDLDDPAVSAFTSLLITGVDIGGTVIIPINAQGTYVKVRKAYKLHRQSQKIRGVRKG